MNNASTPQETEYKIGFDRVKRQDRGQGLPRAKWLKKRFLSVPVTLEVTTISDVGGRRSEVGDQEFQPASSSVDEAPNSRSDSKDQGFQPGGGQAPGADVITPSPQSSPSTGEGGNFSPPPSGGEMKRGGDEGQPSASEWQNATQKAKAIKGAKTAATGTADMAGMAEKAAVANPVVRAVLWIFIGNKKLILNEPMTPVEKYGTILLDLLIFFALIMVVVLLIIIFAGPCLKMAGITDIVGMDKLSELIVKICY